MTGVGTAIITKSAFMISSGSSVNAMPGLSFAWKSSRILPASMSKPIVGRWRGDTRVQAAVRRSPSRRCRRFCRSIYDPCETPCYSFPIYPLWYIKTSPTPILYCLDRCFTWMIGSFMLHQLEFNNFFRKVHIYSY